ncbi:MAG: IS630 family transposase [Nanoarchaeota archaeon]|nr:IS630 family transposase [Nanoarchaeota archaeon]
MGYTLVSFDEVGFRLVPVYHKMRYLVGQKPRGKFFWSNKKITIFGALKDDGELFCEDFVGQNSLTYKAFLSDFIETLDKNKKYVSIFNNASYHKTDVIREYLAEHSNIKVEYLPPYCPELNPIETCWKITRQNVTNSNYFPTIEKLKERLENFWQRYNFTLKFTNYLCP